MRKEVILGVADAIEAGLLLKERGIGFDMCDWIDQHADKQIHPCGTSACIAGWTAALYDADGNRRETPLGVFELKNLSDIETIAADAMGFDLDDDVENARPSELFIPDLLQYIDDKMAVEVLRDFAETGKVEWPHEVLRARDAAACAKANADMEQMRVEYDRARAELERESK